MGGADCGRCSSTQTPCSDAAIDCLPTDQSCLATGEDCLDDHGGSVGRAWWVGAASPLGNDVHLLVTGELDRKASVEWPPLVHVADCEVVPRATYTVTAVDLDHGTESTPLELTTTARPIEGYWADAVGTLSYFCGGTYLGRPCDPDADACPPGQSCQRAWPPADGLIDFDDVMAAVFAFEQESDRPAPDISWLDLQGNAVTVAEVDPPDYVVNFADVQFMLLAFAGRPYPFSDPAECPDVSAWP
jgi:hypothetical protein